MKIRLDDISGEGKEYSFNETSKELKDEFLDLKLNKFQMDVKIRPLDSFYELTGTVEGTAREICGQCGSEIDLQIGKKMNDMILQKPQNPRGSRYSKGYTVNESAGVDVVYHEDGLFDLGEYLHEAVALSIPDYPTCEKNGCPHADEIQKRMDKINRETAEKFGQKEGRGAFDALKGLKFH